MGIPSTDIESYEVGGVNPLEVSSWLAVLVELLKSTAADISSLGACEKLGSSWLNEGQRGFLLANIDFLCMIRLMLVG